MSGPQAIERFLHPAGAGMECSPAAGCAPDRLSAILRSTRGYSPRAPPGRKWCRPVFAPAGNAVNDNSTSGGGVYER
jgi:hypothetical protein